ncbi:EGF-like repeat and discoidin I-like domain-containing protein 3 [Branchiostoma lanceolatum]|uniref:EGF-like repeat and discoidin I-like domain-containing protein 3 n=1 Tax=Branchiostoma lanceolatum TaxID=7740 RepID=UPI0034514C4F
MGTIIQGRNTEDQWVTSYEIQYSIDMINWTTYAGSDDSEMVFPGNVDRSLPVTNLLNNPVDARYVRFVPQSWLGSIAMRVEIAGCNITRIYKATNTQPLINRVRQRQLGFIGHALRLPTEEPLRTYALYVPTHGRRRPGRQKTSYLTYIQNLLGNAEGGPEAITAMATDRRMWRGPAVLPPCPHPFGMESGAIPDNHISASSSHYLRGLEPYRARLNGGDGGAWVAGSNSIGQWLQVDLGEMKRVMGTIIQGRPNIDQRVTSYKLQYSKDRITWTTYAGSDGSEMVFPGNVDRSNPVTNLLNNSVDARYVRFVVQSWYGHIAMRAEIVGCNINCSDPLGMESGAIPDDSITASTVFDIGFEPYYGRINGVAGGGAWLPLYDGIGQWLQVTRPASS